MPSNTSVHKIFDNDNISRQRALRKTNYEENNNSFQYNKNNNNNNNDDDFILKECVAHHRHYNKTRSSRTLASSTSLIKTTKQIPIKIPIKNDIFNISPLAQTRKTPTTTTTTSIKNLSNKNNKNAAHSSEELLQLFEKLKSKAEYFADKDPAFTARLLDITNTFATQGTLKHQQKPSMDPNFYANTYNQHSHYSHPSIYSVHSNFQQPTQQQQQQQQPSNIYSTFSSGVFLDAQQSMPNSYRASNSNSKSKTQGSSSPRSTAKSSTSKSYKSQSKNQSSEQYERQPSSGYNTFTHNYTSSRFDSSNPSAPDYNATNNIYSNYYNYNQNNSNSYTFASYHNNKDVNSEDIFLILEDAYEPNKRIVGDFK